MKCCPRREHVQVNSPKNYVSGRLDLEIINSLSQLKLLKFEKTRWLPHTRTTKPLGWTPANSSTRISPIRHLHQHSVTRNAPPTTNHQMVHLPNHPVAPTQRSANPQSCAGEVKLLKGVTCHMAEWEPLMRLLSPKSRSENMVNRFHFHIILNYIILHYIILYYMILYYIKLYYIILYYIISFYIILYQIIYYWVLLNGKLPKLIRNPFNPRVGGNPEQSAILLGVEVGNRWLHGTILPKSTICRL